MTVREAAALPPSIPPGDGWRAAAELVRGRAPLQPAACIVLGSGLDTVANALEVSAEIPYAELPGFPEPSVPGHAGRLSFGTMFGVPVAVFRGRIHLYEGHGMVVSSMPAILSWALRARGLVLTAAVGALHATLSAGTVVAVSDHLNLMGENPLRGWTRPDGSPAFVDLSSVYDAELLRAAVATAEREESSTGTASARGVYAAVPGPSFETPAEAESFRRAGADVVGMSVVPESVPARALGMRTLGLCSVANTVGVEVGHEEVLAAARRSVSTLAAVLQDVLPLIAEG
jgi:inosine/guanosine/xanthosine phosphorylase family protein